MNKKNIFDWIGIILLILLLLCIVSCDIRSNDEPREEIYNIPVYTTVYDIIYPDSAYRYTCTSHIKMRTRSYKGTNYLEVAYDGYNWRRYKPEWWNDNWKEPEISTTAPIRIVSITVKHKKLKYIRDCYNHIKYTESNGVVSM